MSNKITSLVTSYLDYKRGLGFQMTAEAVYLNAFARYTQDIGYTGALTRKIVEAANLMDIKVNDHIILTNEEFYSYCDEGRI